jgi:hypothetical protein
MEDMEGALPRSRGARGFPNLPRCACADLRCASSFPLLLRLRFKDGETPPLASCYPRLRQVAFGMYMPRFDADVQKQMPKQRSKHHEQHGHHQQPQQ